MSTLQNGLTFWISAMALLIAFALGATACGDADDDDQATDDDDDDADDDVGDDDAIDDDDDDDEDTFPPEEQEPFIEKGLILPEDSLECVPQETGVPQMDCNHHGSAIAQLPGGSMAVVWYHGVSEKSPDARIVWSWLEPGKDQWTWPEVLYDDPERSEGNPALWVGEDCALHVFFVSIYGNGWPQSRIRLIRSLDGGETWNDPVTLRSQYCWMTRHRPLRLQNNDLLLPLYDECLAYPVYMRSTDDFATWTEEPHSDMEYYLGHVGQIQPALVLLDSGRIAAITRDGTPTNRIKRTTSDDQGFTWTPCQALELPNSGTSVDQVRLLDGHVVVIYNDNPEGRFPLSAALSFDGGETFVATRDINADCEQPSCSYSYPSVAQNTTDGTIWVSYSFGRSSIGWVHFNEAWLLEK